jgi:hypothetical protein
LAYVLGATFLAWRRLADTISPDFAVFWEAGARFISGGPLYPLRHVDHSFLYPPFAAWLFQPLALLPQPAAQAAFHFLNLLLWPALVGLTALILKDLAPAWWRGPWPVLLATILTVRFFLWNLELVQTNEVVLFLVLAGVWSFLRGRDVTAVLLVTAATFLKIVPGIFLVWLVFRGRRRTVAALVPAVLFFLVLPLVWRGWPQGFHDLTDYYSRFLSHYLGGGVRVRHDNFNLATLVYSLFVPLHHPAGVGGPILAGGEAVARTVYQALAVILGTGYLASLALLRRRRMGITPFEVSATFLVAALLSGVTWHHHLVSLLFVLASLLACPWKQLPDRWRPAMLVAYLLMILNGVAGRDTIGSGLYDLLVGHLILTWTLLYLLVLCLTLPWVAPAGKPVPETGGQAASPGTVDPT